MLIAGAVLPGCAGSGKDAAGTHAPSGSAKPSAPARTAHETRVDIVAAVAACRHGVDLGTWLPKDSKAQLYASCNQGLRRGLTEIRAFGLEVCNEVAFTAPAKTDAERSRVFTACYAGTKQKTAMIGN